MEGDVAKDELAPKGAQKISWAEEHMPVMEIVAEQIGSTRPFEGRTFGISIHLEAKTARLALALRDGGGRVFITSSNPLSTQDDVAAALNQEEGVTVFARRGVTTEEYAEQLRQVLSKGPEVIIDDGGDLVGMLHGSQQEMAQDVIGGCEETTTGIHRLRSLEEKGELKFPMFAVNDARMKHLFDNRYGTGQSSWDAITRTTNLCIAGSTVVVVGYGWCGRGIAQRADGLGAEVIVVEVDPVRAIEARMAGYRVMKISEAAPRGDFFVTSTGCKNVIPAEALQRMKDGAVMANAGHFNVEIDLEALEEMTEEREEARENIERFKLKDGRTLYLLGEGRLVNLVAGDGHPVEIMDISFALQTLTARYLLENKDSLKNQLHSVPPHVDELVARNKLDSWGIEIDRLSDDQKDYLENWG